MGTWLSKDLKPYDYIAERLQECVKDHDNNLKAIGETVKAQKLVVDLLTKFEGTKQMDCATGKAQAGGAEHTDDSGGKTPTHGDEQPKENETHSDRQILAINQGVLLLQCDIAKTNFKHLKRCLFDSIRDVVEAKNLTKKWTNLKEDLDYALPERYVSSQQSVSSSDASWHNLSIDKRLESLKAKIELHYQQVVAYQNEDKRIRHTQMDQHKLVEKDEEIQKLKDEIAGYKSKFRKQDRELSDASTKETQLHVDNDYLRRQNAELHERNQNLEEKIRKKVKQKVPLQLYFLRNDDLMMTVVHELNAMLNTHTSLHDFELDIHQCKQANEIKPDIPVLALCINASRLGTDAASAINGLRSTPQITLLIFHHKDVHAIPSQRSERMLTGQEFKDLGGIIDLVFLRGKGIYTCDLNEDALRSITRFIKS